MQSHTRRTGNLSTLDFLVILFKYWKVMATVVVISTLVTGVIMWRSPDVYEATAGIALNTTGSIRLTEKDRTLGSVSLRESLNSEVEWLLSTKVLERTLQLAFPEEYAGWSPDERRKQVIMARTRISGLPKRNTSIIEVKLRSPDPEQASLILNHLVQAQLELRAERDPMAGGMLSGKIAATRAELDSVNQIINEVQLGNQVYSADRQISSLVEVNSQVQTRQRELLQDILEKELVVGRYVKVEKNRPEVSHVALPDNNAVLRSIQSRYVELLDQRRDMQNRFSDSSMELKTADAALIAVRDEFYQVLVSTLDALTGQLDLLRREDQTLRERAKQIDAELTRFPATSSRLAALLQHREAVSDLLRILFRQQSEYDLATIGDRANQSLELISPALTPEKPVAPKRVMQTVIVFFLALMASVALAYVLELGSGTFETVQAVESALGAPVITTIRMKRK
jgi:uncharacterized protein involved in exopolysaccharide biosynthesis